MKKLFLIIIVIFSIIFVSLKVNNIVVVLQSLDRININGQPVIKKINEPNVIEAVTLNTKADNKIKVGGITYKVKLRELSKDEYVKIFSLREMKLYKLRTLPSDFIEYKLETKEGYTPGYLFVTIVDDEFRIPKIGVRKPSDLSVGYVVCFKTDGSVAFYYQQKMKFMNFVKHNTTDGKVRYSFNIEAETDDHRSFCPLCYSRIYVLDENFSVIREIAQTDQGYGIDCHSFNMIDEEHYIVNSYIKENRYIPQYNKRMSYHYNIISEIENERTKFMINFDDHPEFFTKYNVGNSPDKFYIDPTHVNSIIIDPKDNNLIISLNTASSVIKVNRETQEIMWILGGRGDMFGLTPEQKSITQHSLSFTKDGYLMLLNNSCSFWLNDEYIHEFNRRSRSSILQYKLDEENKKLIDFRKMMLDIHVVAQGSVYELSPNRYIIGYGVHTNRRIDNDKRNIIAYEMDDTGKKYMTLTVPDGYISYKAKLYETLD